MKKEIICTVCPMGCRITVEGEGENITCHPVRILTTTVKTNSEKTPLVPVRSEKPLPKEKIMDCMEVIRKQEAKTPIAAYDVIVENICDTGINIVATGSVK